MIDTKITASVAEHQRHLETHLRQVRETNHPLFVTVDGRTEAVVLSPDLYDRLVQAYDLDQDTLAMQRAMKQYKNGEGRPAEKFFDELRAELLAMKAVQDAKTKGPAAAVETE